MCTILVSNSFEVCLPTCLLFPPPAPWFDMYSMCMHAHMTVHMHMHHMYVDMHTYVYMRMHSMYRRSVGGGSSLDHPHQEIVFVFVSRARACGWAGGRSESGCTVLFSRRFRPPPRATFPFPFLALGVFPYPFHAFEAHGVAGLPGFGAFRRVLDEF